MQFVEVLPGDATYHGHEPLTYGSRDRLAIGTIVSVPLRKKHILGVVVKSAQRPAFAVKQIDKALPLPPLPTELIELISWIAAYYPAALGIITQLMLPKALPKKPMIAAVALSPATASPELTKDQKKVLSSVNNQGLHLLHGETGTGKTRIYIELAKRAINAGRSVIILTPEIGLTSQLANNFVEVFGQGVIIQHSKLSEATRKQNWQYMLEQTKPQIVIGARSALFSPIRNVGLIVIDEAHETAYKQDQAPYYLTTTVAAKLASFHRAQLILGSATPLVSDYYIAKAKGRPILRMTETASKFIDSQRTIEIIDIRDRNLFTKSPHLSNALINRMETALQNGAQILLFLNRRGTARIVFCERCGWQATCPHCDLALIYHGDTHTMRCHSCDFKTSSPPGCPECQNPSIVYKTIGTKAIVEEVGRLFPEAITMRFDTDNMQSERMEQQYEALREGKINILVGTQTIAKGLDLPNLGLVGILIADSGLNFPDFSAEERTYQLLTQVIGRVGRGHRAGQVVLQTYTPESPLIRAITAGDWDYFYNKELDERRRFVFPPFCYILKLQCKRATSISSEHTARALAEQLRSRRYKIAIEGPAPSFHEKLQNKFIWQIIVKSTQRSELVKIIKELPSGWSYDIDPMNLL